MNEVTATRAPWKQRKSLREAELRCWMGGVLFAIYSLIGNLQYAYMAEFPDRRIYICLLGMDLAIAAGIWLNSRAFAIGAILLCVGRIVSVYQLDTYYAMAFVAGIHAIGLAAALAGARGSFVLKRHTDTPKKPSFARRILLAGAMLSVFGSFIAEGILKWPGG